MDNRTRTIKRWQKNDNMTLDEMYEKCVEKGWTNYLVETEQFLRDFVIDMVNRGCSVAPLLQSIEDNTVADYFAFDVTGWSNTPAKPIFDKDDLAKYLLE